MLRVKAHQGSINPAHIQLKNQKGYILFIVSALVILGFQIAEAQQNLAQQAYAIFEQSCLNCHGEHGAFTEEIIIDHAALIETGAVVPRNPGASELLQRLLDKRPERRMPQGQPALSRARIDTIRRWILAGAPNWETPQPDSAFITPREMLETIEKHVNSLPVFDRSFTRYFTMTHLYNAGEANEALRAYQRALSKLVNSLSWGRKVIRPKAINPKQTLFTIDLRDYEWEIGVNRWTQIEQTYPYVDAFNAPTEKHLQKKLENLRKTLDCDVPYVQVDWFLATAALPPLYHDILGLPVTDRHLETRLEVNVVENIRNAPGRRVWRAGFNNSGVSNHNRVVERHTSRYGAYWKSYDFAGSKEKQNIFRHPLSFKHDGGEIIFNLPNGLQAYLLVDAGGRRLDEAPINIVRNLAASDPIVRNGLSCIGCHTEGMKDFQDTVRGVIQRNANPPFNKARALQLYTDKATMDRLLREDTAHYRQALETAGGIFGGIEPIQRFHEAFSRPLDTHHAAASVGLQAKTFLQRIRQSVGLQNLGLSVLLEDETIKRDTWTANYADILLALDFPSKKDTSIDTQEEIIPGELVHIPDSNLHAAIAETLGKASGLPITAAEMATIEELVARDRGIRDLTGIEYAVNAWGFRLQNNEISDISPFIALRQHGNIDSLSLEHNKISDLSPLAGHPKIQWLGLGGNTEITDLSPLVGLTNLKGLWLLNSDKITDISPLAGMTQLKQFTIWGSPISDLSPLVGLTNLEGLDICGSKASDISVIGKLTWLKELYLAENGITDVSALRNLKGLTRLSLAGNEISDIAPLASLRNLEWLALQRNEIQRLSALGPVSKTTKILWHENPGYPKGGPKIEGPWLWVTVPGKRLEKTKDSLAAASGGVVTEQKIATLGATEGTAVGESIWQSSSLHPAHGDNIGIALRSLGIETPTHPDFSVYGVVTLYAPRKQDTTMFAGSQTNHKVWLNGELVHTNLNGVWAHDYENFFPVTLKQGTNILLVAVDNSFGWNWSGFFGFQPDTDYTVSTPRLSYAFSKPDIHVGDNFTLDIRAEDIYDFAGWQFDIAFDPRALEAIEIQEGDFLKTGGESTFFRKGTINNPLGKITGLSSARLSGDGVNGTGTLLSVTFKAIAGGELLLKLNKFQFGSGTGGLLSLSPHEVAIRISGHLATGDVNRDGTVSILDMILIARHLGETNPANTAIDVNGDGVVNVLDLIVIAKHFGESTAAAPSMIRGELIPAMIQTWINTAELEDDGSIVFQEGIANLQKLLASLIPKETSLLANYPNPSNPETWIPYQLAEGSNVDITVYGIEGKLIRKLELGYKPAGLYTSKSRSAYWDGANMFGETVASGVYFYTLTAGNFTATRKLLIQR